MSMKEFIGIHIGSMFDAKGFKQADTATAKLNRAVRTLNIGYALTAASAIAFGKASVNAFIADEAAASKLSMAVKNLGLDFANPYITDYIANMEKMTKVADDELRPAFQTLISQTGSLANSQKLLSTAIEVSRGSGYGLSEVANDLAQAYIGNTKGLKKYNLGLSAAALKAKSFTEIQAIMNNQFSGSSAAYLETYSGQVGVLSLAWGNFQENVGGALLTMASFGSGGESKGLSNLATLLEKIGGAVNLISKGWDSVAKLLNVTGEGGILSGFNPYRTTSPNKTDSAANPMDKYAKLLAKIEADRKKQNDIVLKNQRALTAEQKKQAALKKAGTIFDMEQINLVAALKKNLSEDERKRAELQLAIITENVTEAQKLTYEIARSNGLTVDMAKNLASLPAAKNPFEAWKAWLDQIEAQVNRIASARGAAPSTNVPTNMGNPNGVYDYSSASPSFTYGQNTAPVYVEVTLDGEQLTAEITKKQTNNYLSGKILALERLNPNFG